MRTKALLLSAALVAAGATSGIAQTVYSINAVGYVNKTIPIGFSMICNPLNTTNNTLAVLFPTAPDGAAIYKFTGSGFTPSLMDDLGEWSNPNITLNPGEGCFIFSPVQFTNTFVGEVVQSPNATTPLTNAYPAGFSIRGSQVPQDGLATSLGFTPPEGSTVYKLNPGGAGYTPYQVDDLGWANEPSFAVGEAFWIFSPVAANWTRTFLINP
jgi:hypothetical protein